ncbi:hypothetical protein FNF29_07775 [Cafeteria roenbergensis]|uniref:Exoribonuclease phosphorolytic domain-containing protein n=1 Tax=Cafeteria roenbergensis TaxID=33653 RepID=A0A5A8C283_CAFRO|nr:hypothetical protein FNF29_07775 [Cafeteria roenbergensis]|eukprot:KAA0146894.1 hypothetical protein FNF29_07775 [Cafeteria roenbergensis]
MSGGLRVQVGTGGEAADGSSVVQVGGFTAVASVFGPRASAPAQAVFSEAAALVVDVHIPLPLHSLPARVAAAAGLATRTSGVVDSTPGADGVGTAAGAEALAASHALAQLAPVEEVVSSSSLAGRQSDAERAVAAAVRSALMPALLLTRFPKSVIHVSLALAAAPAGCVDASGTVSGAAVCQLIPALVCAASAALLDAGIDSSGIVAAASSGSDGSAAGQVTVSAVVHRQGDSEPLRTFVTSSGAGDDGEASHAAAIASASEAARRAAGVIRAAALARLAAAK